MTSYNLLDAPWIPVNGQRASLLTVLQRAPHLEAVRHPSPLVTIAIYRLLLAFLHRALQGPEDVEQALTWWKAGEFPSSPVEEYAAEFRPRFDLFDTARPFYQLAGDLPESFIDPWTRLTAEHGSGNTSYLFNHTRRDPHTALAEAGMDYAEAACRLLEFQSFALGGLMKRFVTSSPGGLGVGKALMLTKGRNLFETLCLNLVPYAAYDRSLDQPVWERKPYSVEELNRSDGHTENCGGITSGYTWFARSVRLIPEEGQVRRVAIAAGSIAEGTEARPDPMVAILNNEKGEGRPLSFRDDREFWRDLHALLPQPARATDRASAVSEHAAKLLRRAKDSRRAAFAVYGVTNSKAKVTGVCEEDFELPAVAFQVDEFSLFVKECLDRAENVRRELRGAGQTLARRLLTRGDREPLAKDVAALANSFPHMAAYLSRAREDFLAFLLEIPDSESEFYSTSESLSQRWREQLNQRARAAFRLAERAAGQNAKALKASIEAGRQLERGLRKESP